MNQGMQDDFKRDGFVSQLMTRLGRLEAFEREFRLKKFTGSGGNPLWVPWGVYVDHSPLINNPSFPYGATIDRDMTFVSWSQAVFVIAPNNALNYWTIEMHSLNNGTGDPIVNSIITSGIAAATWTLMTDATFAIASLSLAGGDMGLYIKCVKSAGAPGNLYLFGPSLEVTAP